MNSRCAHTVITDFEKEMTQTQVADSGDLALWHTSYFTLDKLILTHLPQFPLPSTQGSHLPLHKDTITRNTENIENVFSKY